MAFCPKCGKITDKFELCADCSPKGETLDDKDIMVCARCGAIKFFNLWEKESDMKEIIQRMLKKIYHFNTFSSFFTDEKKEGKRIWHDVRFKSKGKDYRLKVKIDKQECPSCSISKSSYFEGVLQLRNATEQSLSFINNEIDKASQKGVHITKTIRVGTGADYYLTNKTFTINLGRKLNKLFGGRISANERIFSLDKQTSKDIFRVSVLVELPEVMEKDIVEIHGQIVAVSSLSKELKGINLSNNKRISLKYSSEKLLILPKKKTMVTKSYPHVEVMHPETYQSVVPKNSSIADLKKEENVRVVEDSKGNIWICEVKKLLAKDSD